MFPRAALGAYASLPRLCSPINTLHTRSLSPNIRIGKELFQISVDVRHFNKDEIRVKAHPEYVVIEGKQEKDTQHGYILRQFVRKFKLPEGCTPQDIKCSLNHDGMLTVKAQRSYVDMSKPSEVIPVWSNMGTNVKNNPTEPTTVSTIFAELCKQFPQLKRRRTK